MSAAETRGAAPLGRTRRLTFWFWIALTSVVVAFTAGASLVVQLVEAELWLVAVVVPVTNVLQLAIGLAWLVWLVRSRARPTRPSRGGADFEAAA